MLRRGALIYALLVVLAGASLIREALLGRLARLEEKWWALIARQATPATPAGKVTLVEITGDTLSKHPWPWGPDDFALFFQAVLPFQPAVLSAEAPLEFDRDVQDEPAQVFEKMLHDNILRSPKLVLGGQLGWSSDPETVQDLQPMPVLRKVSGDLSRVPEFTAVEAWAAEDYRLTTQPGWTNVPEGPGLRGSCPLILRYRGQPVPAIALQIAMHREKVTLDEVDVVLGSHVNIGKSKRVPIDATGRMLLNVGAEFARVSYDDLLLSREQIERKEPPVKPAGLFEGRVVFLARTDPGARTLPMPDGRIVSPGEFIATSLATIEIGAFPRRIGNWFDWTLVGVIAVCALWIRKWKPLATVVITVAALVAYASCAWWLFRSGQTLLPGLLVAGIAVWVLLLRLVVRRIEKIIAF